MIVAIVLSLLIPQQPFISIGLMIASWLFFFMGMRIDTNQLRPLARAGIRQGCAPSPEEGKQEEEIALTEKGFCPFLFRFARSGKRGLTSFATLIERCIYAIGFLER